MDTPSQSSVLVWFNNMNDRHCKRRHLVDTIILATVTASEVGAFQSIKQNHSPHRITDHHESTSSTNDAATRRDVLKDMLVATSAFSIALVSPQQSTARTPSVYEGDLIVSKPPPDRFVDEDDIDCDDASTTTTNKTQAVSPDEVPANKKKLSDPRFFIAGGVSAAISHGVTTPLDVVKTRMQTDPSLVNSSPQEAALQIIENEGPAALTVGLGPTVVGYGVEGALKFGVYESLKPMFLSLFHIANGGDPTEPYLVAAICAGALASIILCPMEETRIRLVTDPSFGKGLIDGLPKLLKEEGALAPFQRGILPMFSKQIPYTMGKVSAF